MSLTTPVAFFIFNRPDVTRAVFDEIAKARPTTLLVIADGPRSLEERSICEEARAVIDGVNWPCEVTTQYSERNMGCKNRISSGLNWVFSQYDEAIILEDDCVPEPSFFSFCERMLAYYRLDERVAMITGTNYLLDQLNVPESYVFSRYFSIWGWATWKRAWDKYDVSLSDWEDLKAAGQIRGFYSQPFMQDFVTANFDQVYQGKIDTWDIQWTYSCLFDSSVCVVPRVNLISNIGTVGHHSSGQDRNHFKPIFALDTTTLHHPRRVFPDQRYDGPFFKQQFQPPSPPWFPIRAARAVRRRLQAFLRDKKSWLLNR